MSLNIFDKSSGTCKEVANKTSAAIVDTELSNDSENPVQNKVIKAEFDKVKESTKLITYTNLADIGLTELSYVNSIEDVATVVNAMADRSMSIQTFANGQYGLKSNGVGVIEIIKHNINRVTLKVIDNNDKTFYYATYHGTSGFSGWYAVTGTLLS